MGQVGDIVVVSQSQQILTGNLFYDRLKSVPTPGNQINGGVTVISLDTEDLFLPFSLTRLG